MTNEELAVRIQAGENNLTPALWAQTKKLIIALFKQLLRRSEGSNGRCTRAGVTLDDLEQEGYFALLEAVGAYKPDKAHKFTTYLKYPVMTRFFQTIGMRTSKQCGDPLSKAYSLETPVAGESLDINLGDSVADDTALEALEDVVESVYIEQLHNALEVCLATLPEDQELVIRQKYYMNLTFTEIAQQKGCHPSWSREQLNKGLRKLRGGKSVRLLRPFVQCNDGYQSYSVGLQSFKHAGASSVVLAAERRAN